MKEQKNRMVNDRDYRLPENFVYPDKEKLKLLIRLAGMITDRYVAKYTHTIQPDDPEIWCLDEVMSRDEVKFMLSFQKTRTSYSHEQLVKKNPSFSEKQIDEMLQHRADLCAGHRRIHGDERQADGGAPEYRDLLQPDDTDAA